MLTVGIVVELEGQGQYDLTSLATKRLARLNLFLQQVFENFLRF